MKTVSAEFMAMLVKRLEAEGLKPATPVMVHLFAADNAPRSCALRVAFRDQYGALYMISGELIVERDFQRERLAEEGLLHDFGECSCDKGDKP